MGHYKRYSPILKGRGFCPNPIAVYGIPPYADSATNPIVDGTIAHTEWWEEQVRICLEGYWTGGIYIPGRYYYYLNFCYISTIGRGLHFPDFVDIDLEFFLLVEEAKRTQKGIICVKKRRVGLSEKWAKGIAGYGLRFNPEKYKAGIVAGLKEYSDELFTKFKEGNSHCPPEFRVQTLFDSNEQYVAGWKEKDPSGKLIRAGSQNEVICKTMFQNPNVMKGNLLYDVAFEESGENGMLKKGRNATAKCLEVGQEKVGTEYIYGTGGNIKSGSADFLDMWHDADKYGLLKIPIYGDRLMISTFVGSVNQRGEVVDNCPNIFKEFPLGDGPGEYSYEQLIGMEDTKEAVRIINDKKKELIKAKDKSLYWNYVQEHPLHDRDAFLKYNNNLFNKKILSDCLDDLLSQEFPRYVRVLLDLKKVEDPNSPEHGMPLDPPEIEWRFAPDELEDEDCILVDRFPAPGFKDLDIGGVDSYDQDQALTSKSLGAMEVYRRNNNFRDASGNELGSDLPVCIMRTRPPRKETFYHNGLLIAIWYNLVGNVNFDIEKQLIMEYWAANGGKKFFAPRPKTLEKKDSQQTHQYGTKFTVTSKPWMLGRTQTYIEDFAQNPDGTARIAFPVWYQEHQDYDVEQVDSDWDLADAHGLCEILDHDMKHRKKLPQQTASSTTKDPFAITVWAPDGETRASWEDANALNDPDGGDMFIRQIRAGVYR